MEKGKIALIIYANKNLVKAKGKIAFITYKKINDNDIVMTITKFLCNENTFKGGFLIDGRLFQKIILKKDSLLQSY